MNRRNVFAVIAAFAAAPFAFFCSRRSSYAEPSKPRRFTWRLRRDNSKEMELRKLDLIEAWAKSARVESQQEVVAEWPDHSRYENYRVRIVKIVKPKTGDPAFLQIIDVQNRRAALLGLR